MFGFLVSTPPHPDLTDTIYLGRIDTRKGSQADADPLGQPGFTRAGHLTPVMAEGFLTDGALFCSAPCHLRGVHSLRAFVIDSESVEGHSAAGNGDRIRWLKLIAARKSRPRSAVSTTSFSGVADPAQALRRTNASDTASVIPVRLKAASRELAREIRRLLRKSRVAATVRDVAGREIRQLIPRGTRFVPGSYVITWDGRSKA